jgi:hypothetical protein
MLLLLLACATPEEDVTCAAWPDAASAPDGVVEDSCGWWQIAVGDHLYVNVYLAEADATCSDALGDGLVLNSDPIYTNMSDDAPKFTYDIVGDAAGTALGVDITCDDGTRWGAQVDVQ